MTQQYSIDTLLAKRGIAVMSAQVRFQRQFIFQQLMAIMGLVKVRALIIPHENPTRSVLEDTVAKLENGDRGFAFASGMAAIQVLMNLFKGPDEWIVSSDVYGGTYRLLDFAYKNNNSVKPVYVNAASLAEIEAAITANTKAIFIETPSNPLMEECDVVRISKLAKKHNLLMIVDNTFLNSCAISSIRFRRRYCNPQWHKIYCRSQ